MKLSSGISNFVYTIEVILNQWSSAFTWYFLILFWYQDWGKDISLYTAFVPHLAHRVLPIGTMVLPKATNRKNFNKNLEPSWSSYSIIHKYLYVNWCTFYNNETHFLDIAHLAIDVHQIWTF